MKSHISKLTTKIRGIAGWSAARKRRAYLKLGGVVVFLVALLLFIPPVWLLKTSHITVTRYLKKGTVEAKVGPKEKDWIPIRTVSRHVLNAIVVAEDGRFYNHGGLDFTEILNSAAINMKKGRYVRGGSTITQQVVKVAFLSRDKNIVRKAREALGAMLLERILTKDEILEWYINLVEFGDGVYGIKAAAKHYFNIKPELLTIEQGANLALVLPSPNAWSVGLRRRQLTPFGHQRYARIITAMRQAGLITETLWLHALATGDFGRPVRAYEDALVRVKAKDFGEADDELFDEPEPGPEEVSIEKKDALERPPEEPAPSPEPSQAPSEEAGDVVSDEIEVPAPEGDTPAASDEASNEVESLPLAN